MLVNRVIDLMTVGAVHAFMVPQMRRTPVNTSFVPDTARLFDWTELLSTLQEAYERS